MPQSEEHLRILELLGVAPRAGRDHEGRPRRRRDARARAARGRRAPRGVGAARPRRSWSCDSVTGAGSTTCAPPRRRARRRRRPHATTVAPGSGSTACSRPRARAPSSPARSPAGPSRSTTTWRSGAGGCAPESGRIETAHRQVERAAPGTRVALNLVGVEHHELARGDAVVRPRPVDLRPHRRRRAHRRAGRDPRAARPGAGLRGLGRARRLGTRARRRRPTSSASGSRRALPLAPGDRIVLRDPGSKRTVAGAEVLDVEPVTKARDAPAVLALPLGERLLATHSWLAAADLPRLGGPVSRGGPAPLRPTSSRAGRAESVDRWLVATPVARSLRAAATERVLAHHRDHPLERGLDLAALGCVAPRRRRPAPRAARRRARPRDRTGIGASHLARGRRGRVARGAQAARRARRVTVLASRTGRGRRDARAGADADA